MIICHCKKVSDRELRRHVREGAATRGALARACSAGTRCGGCRPAIEQIIEEERGGKSVRHLELAPTQG